ncbi:hypothetical protein RDT67_28455, partial [Serratia fonticola]
WAVSGCFYDEYVIEGHSLECQSTSVDKYFILDRPVVDFELLFGHGAPNYSQEHGDLPLIMAKSSIYSTRQYGNFLRVNVDHSNYLRLFFTNFLSFNHNDFFGFDE